jgi:uncharacterized membrane-anchored protein
MLKPGEARSSLQGGTAAFSIDGGSNHCGEGSIRSTLLPLLQVVEWNSPRDPNGPTAPKGAMADEAIAPAAGFRRWLTTPGQLRVPEIAVAFWVLKGLSTALGEATSDFLVHSIDPVVAVLLGFVAFLLALVLQFRAGRYLAWAYWFAVAMVGVFGTMAADVLHVRFGVPYAASSLLYTAILLAVFVSWQRTETTLSIHSINTPRREMFYWAAVAATFAAGTALGDFTAYTLGLGYLASVVLFVGIIAIPAVGYRWLGWNAVLSFWFAYVVTRPLGASIADALGKPKDLGGLGFGDGTVALVCALLMFTIVTYLAVTKADTQTTLVVEAELP